MHRIDGAGHVDHLFVAEDPATLRPPTEITPEIMNAFQEELATFIEWAGIVLAKGDNTQLRHALEAKFSGIDVAATKAGVQGQTYTAFTTAGATGAFNLTPAPAIAAYAAGQRFRVKFHAGGSGSDVLNINGLGNKNLKQRDSSGAKVAPIIVADQLADIEYDGADLVICNPLYLGLQYFHARDEKPNGTTGGNSITGSQKRTLNTVLRNTIAGASLAANNITLPAGTYRVHATAPAAGQVVHKAFLQNETDATTLFVGTSEDPGSDSMSRSVVIGSFTLAAQKTISLYHFVSLAITQA